MRVVACTQRSPAWHEARLGKLTGSRAAQAFGGGASRQTWLHQLVRERRLGRSQESTYCSPHMARGIQTEPAAVAAYEAHTGTLVRQVGFVVHDELEAGYSPDGVTDAGVLEVKCPTAITHWDYVQGGVPWPKAYRTQVTHALWLTGAAWVDLVSYHPEFGEALQLTVTRVEERAVDLAAYDAGVRRFLAGVDQALARPWGRVARPAVGVVSARLAAP